MSFAVTLSTAASGPVTASYTTAGGSATASVDFGSALGTVSFAAGETNKTIAVSAIGDTTVEPNETFTVTLSAPTGATLADAVAIGTIVNDDVPSDTMPPSVTARIPSPGATGIAATSVVTATFSEAVAPATATAGGFTLRAAGAPADVAATVAVNGATASLTPAAALAANTTYTATLSATVTDLAGNAMGAPVTWSFTTVAPPPAGLIAAYAFDETTGATAADASGSGRTGTLSGATWTSSGKNGGALSFDGINNLVTVADAASLNLTTALTLEAWVHPASDSSWRTVVLKEASSDLAYALYASGDVARPSGWARIGSSLSATGPAALPLNAWSHLAVTLGGGTLRLYVDGVQVATAAVSGAISATAQPLRIGGNSLWGEYFAGLLDDVRIYNRALTAAEIQADMQTPVAGAQ